MGAGAGGDWVAFEKTELSEALAYGSVDVAFLGGG